MKKTLYISGRDDQRLSVLVERPGGGKDKKDGPKTMVIMLHDFPGDKDGNYGLYAHLEPVISSKGHHTLRFDFMGCGQSDGPAEAFTLKSAYDDLHVVMEWCRQEGYERFILVGEGLGAAVACFSSDHDTRAMILVSSQVDLKRAAARFREDSEPVEGENFLLFGGFKVGQGLLSQLDRQEVVPFLESVSCPVLIMHGAHDRVAPPENLDLFRRHLASRRIEITTFEDGDNSLQGENHRKFMFFHIMQFIEKYA